MKYVESTDENPLGLIVENKDDLMTLLQMCIVEMEKINKLLLQIWNPNAKHD